MSSAPWSAATCRSLSRLGDLSPMQPDAPVEPVTFVTPTAFWTAVAGGHGADTAFERREVSLPASVPVQKAVSAPIPSATAVQDAPGSTVTSGLSGRQLVFSQMLCKKLRGAHAPRQVVSRKSCDRSQHSKA